MKRKILFFLLIIFCSNAISKAIYLPLEINSTNEITNGVGFFEINTLGQEFSNEQCLHITWSEKQIPIKIEEFKTNETKIFFPLKEKIVPNITYSEYKFWIDCSAEFKTFELNWENGISEFAANYEKKSYKLGARGYDSASINITEKIMLNTSIESGGAYGPPKYSSSNLFVSMKSLNKMFKITGKMKHYVQNSSVSNGDNYFYIYFGNDKFEIPPNVIKCNKYSFGEFVCNFFIEIKPTFNGLNVCYELTKDNEEKKCEEYETQPFFSIFLSSSVNGSNQWPWFKKSALEVEIDSIEQNSFARAFYPISDNNYHFIEKNYEPSWEIIYPKENSIIDPFFNTKINISGNDIDSNKFFLELKYFDKNSFMLHEEKIEFNNECLIFDFNNTKFNCDFDLNYPKINDKIKLEVTLSDYVNNSKILLPLELKHNSPIGKIFLKLDKNITNKTIIPIQLVIDSDYNKNFQMKFSCNKIDWSNWTNFSKNYEFNLNSKICNLENGFKTIFVKFMDEFNFDSNISFVNFILDTIFPPIPEFDYYLDKQNRKIIFEFNEFEKNTENYVEFNGKQILKISKKREVIDWIEGVYLISSTDLAKNKSFSNEINVPKISNDKDNKDSKDNPSYHIIIPDKTEIIQDANTIEIEFDNVFEFNIENEEENIEKGFHKITNEEKIEPLKFEENIKIEKEIENYFSISPYTFLLGLIPLFIFLSRKKFIKKEEKKKMVQIIPFYSEESSLDFEK